MPDQEPTRSKRNSLGKGLNSLLGLESEANGQTPRNSSESTPAETQLIQVSVSQIKPNPQQPRKKFDEHDLGELAQSLKTDGVVQPLVVTQNEDQTYTLIAGERRWRASKRAGLDKVPVLIKDVAPDEMLRIALIENVQRANLNVIEEAQAYAALIKDFGLTQEECAKKVGKDRATVTNMLRVLNLPKEIQEDLINHKLTMGHGRALLALSEPSTMLKARDLILARNLNVRQTEQLVKRIKKNGWQDKPESAQKSSDLEYLAESLRSHLRTKVKLSGSGARGKIEISYFSAAELERLLEMIGGQHFG